MRLKLWRKRGYLCHLLLAGMFAVSLPVAFSALGERPEVVGATAFLLLPLIGAGAVTFLCATYWSLRASSDLALLGLWGIAFVVVVAWFAVPGIVPMVLETVYIVVTAVFAFRWYAENKRASAVS